MGLRRSEALGLCWDFVYCEADTITISRTVSRVTTIVAKGKNNSSRHSFPMTPDIKKLLLNLNAQAGEGPDIYWRHLSRLRLYVSLERQQAVLSGLRHCEISKSSQSARDAKIRFHELRHSAASNLLSMGFSPMDVQEWLGHSDIKTTANIYGHLDVRRKVHGQGACRVRLRRTSTAAGVRKC